MSHPFRLIGLDQYELGLIPQSDRTRRVLQQGTKHPDLSEAEQRICIAAA